MSYELPGRNYFPGLTECNGEKNWRQQAGGRLEANPNASVLPPASCFLHPVT